MTSGTCESFDVEIIADRYRHTLSAVLMRLHQIQRELDKLDVQRRGLEGELVLNPMAEFDKPSDVLKDLNLSVSEKKKALETLEQDAHQLLTASNEGMAPLRDHLRKYEPKLDEVVKAKSHIGEKPKHKPAQ